MNTSLSYAFTFYDQQNCVRNSTTKRVNKDFPTFIKKCQHPQGAVPGVRLNKGCTEGAHGEISCAEEANAQLPGRSRVRTFAITLSRLSADFWPDLAIAPEKADKIDWDMSMFFERSPLLRHLPYYRARNRTNSTRPLPHCFVQ